MFHEAIDETGKRYGRLLVLDRFGTTGTRATWRCQCDCGKIVIVGGQYLRSARTVSCGCKKAEAVGNRQRKHGLYRTPEWRIWCGLRNRCNNLNNRSYPDYGGSGIYVCQRWMESFTNFLDDMGPRPSSKHTVDRYPDKDGPYAPSNCRWATMREQNRNRKSNRLITINGVTKLLIEWIEESGKSKRLVSNRISRGGWPIERALSEPVRTIRRNI
jgi:hypothetical protein